MSNTNWDWRTPTSAWKLQLHLLVEQLTTSLSATMNQHNSHETTVICILSNISKMLGYCCYTTTFSLV